LPSYEADLAEFERYNTQVLGISIDSPPCNNAFAESLGVENVPLLSDFWPHGEVAKRYGVLRKEGYCERALFMWTKRASSATLTSTTLTTSLTTRSLFDILKELEGG